MTEDSRQFWRLLFVFAFFILSLSRFSPSISVLPSPVIENFVFEFLREERKETKIKIRENIIESLNIHDAISTKHEFSRLSDQIFKQGETKKIRKIGIFIFFPENEMKAKKEAQAKQIKKGNKKLA